MKKWTKYIIVILIAVIAAAVIYSRVLKPKMITAAIEKDGLKVDRIIHEEDLPEGVIVFFTDKASEDTKSLRCAYLEKSLFHYKWINGGGMSGGDDMPSGYFTISEDSPYSVAYGFMNNKSISKVKLNIDDKDMVNPKIIKSKDMVIWYTIFSNRSPKRLEAYAMSDSGENIETKLLVNTQD